MLGPVPSDGLNPARPKQYLFCALKYYVVNVLIDSILSNPRVLANPKFLSALHSTLELASEQRMTTQEFRQLFSDFYSNNYFGNMSYEFYMLRQLLSRSFLEKRRRELDGDD
jgi:hypothetical protein